MGLRMPRLGGAIMLACLALAGPAHAQERWKAAWNNSQQIPEERNALPVADMKDATLRQIVRVQIGGEKLRVRFSNAFGTQPLVIGAATIAISPDNAGARVDGTTLRKLSFNGKPAIMVPAGAEYWSDAVTLPVKGGTDLAISLYLPEAPAQQTSHPGSRATSWYVHGDQTAAADLADPKGVDHWYQLAGIEIVSSKASAVVVLGDSITDGSGTRPNTNQRWTDHLQLRLRADPKLRDMAVLNAGLGGNRLLLDGLGPNSLARFDRDVLTPPGVTHLIILEGVNDLGTLTRDQPVSAEEHAALVDRMIGAYRQMVSRARSRGIKAIGATILPYGGSGYYHPDALNHADREAVNAWIRAPGNFDAVIDFDAVMRDPVKPTHLLPVFDTGDGLHPSIIGYHATAQAVPLELLGGSKARPRPAPKGPAIAFTVDDLPIHAATPPGETQLSIAQDLLAAFTAAKAPGVVGFINGARVEREPETIAVLEAWRKAGYPLANHGWAHQNLNDITDEQFADQVARNEPLLRKLMGSEDWRWFRFPYLSEATQDPARRARVRKILWDRGYKVAPVTIDFGDWQYNGTYARCMAKGDQAAVAEMEKAWLAGVENSIRRYRAMSQALHGRDIPYVLLMHMGGFDARMMPRTLALYRKHGFRFITLDEAMRDPFYRTDVNPSLEPDPQGLEGATRAKGLQVPPGLPRTINLETLCQ
jgi:peptidoglycan/xylan/chitin deacetylase (PgdA/CDA1 family)/lysophospholipase L1-like esterase